MTKLAEILTPSDPKKVTSRAGTLGAGAVGGEKAWELESLEDRYVVVGIPDERGVEANFGNPGAAAGPQAFRKAFYKLYDTHVRTVAGKPRALAARFVDFGDVTLTEDIASTHERLAAAVEQILRKKPAMLFVVGGGHDFSYGSFKGHYAAKRELIPIVNLDAHFDLRSDEAGINSGTPFFRIIEKMPKAIASGAALLELGIQRDRNPHTLYEYAQKHKVGIVEYEPSVGWTNVASERTVPPLEHVFDHLDECAKFGWNRASGSMHLSLDLDVFSAHVAPGTSASTPFGVSVEECFPVLSYLARTSCCSVVDLAELCPTRDHNEQTARLAAGIVYRMTVLREECGVG